MEKELVRAKKNIHVSIAIFKLGNPGEYVEFLNIFKHKYGEDTIKAALKELYMFNREIKDIKGLTAALVIKNHNL